MKKKNIKVKLETSSSTPCLKSWEAGLPRLSGLASNHIWWAAAASSSPAITGKHHQLPQMNATEMLKTLLQFLLKSDILLWKMFEQSNDGCSLVYCCQDKLPLHISDADHVFAAMIELLKNKQTNIHSTELSRLCLNQHQLEISWAYSAASKPTKANRLDPSQRLFCSSKWICPL